MTSLSASTPTPLSASTPVETPWDPQLAADMSRRGIAVHEESLLGVLLGDLGLADGVPER
ncbi:DUF2399 domain-containing protein [Jiangella aurantiaca]|uniref:DUF2399 domain-containing protein n=1 Tax=Jiangella aurantiaca TaxID=2530373 RepID=A0A4R5AJR3_9ACTN|nr:DUF2399 domain-containing protein [Jiangella aurantiaca]